MITPGVCTNLYTLVKTSHGTDKLFDRLNVLKFANIEEVEQKFFLVKSASYMHEKINNFYLQAQ